MYGIWMLFRAIRAYGAIIYLTLSAKSVYSSTHAKAAPVVRLVEVKAAKCDKLKPHQLRVAELLAPYGLKVELLNPED